MLQVGPRCTWRPRVHPAKHLLGLLAIALPQSCLLRSMPADQPALCRRARAPESETITVSNPLSASSRLSVSWTCSGTDEGSQ